MDDIHMPSCAIAQSRSTLLTAVEAARVKAGRSGAPTLVAVSKKQPEERIDAALAAGQRVFGENRVQEARERWGHRRARYDGLELRLIGSLQTNKAEEAVKLFDVIETIDRPKLARALARAMAKIGRSTPVLIQVNTGEEPQKSGIAPANLGSLVGEVRALGLNLEGLMCLPPTGEPVGPHFGFLAQLARHHGLGVLSMGMSGDFETAIRFGATHVRVGTGFFGARES